MQGLHLPQSGRESDGLECQRKSLQLMKNHTLRWGKSRQARLVDLGSISIPCHSHSMLLPGFKIASLAQMKPAEEELRSSWQSPWPSLWA